MNFREFVEKDKTRIPVHKPVPKPIVEEYEDDYQEPVRKTVKRVPVKEVEEYEEEILDEDYYVDEELEDEDYYEEPVRRVPKQRPVQQIKKPIVQQPQYRTIQRPVQRTVVKTNHVPGYAMPEDQFRRPLVVTQKQLKESTIEGTANTLTEAIKRKVDTVFYRFGIQGLEKLDEKILDTIEELQYPEQKQVKKPLREMRRVPSKRPIKKTRPLPLEQIKPVPQYEEEQEYVEPIYEEPVEELIEEPIVEEPEIVPEQPPVKVVKRITSPKPKFLQQSSEPETKEEIQPESTGDVNEDMMAAVMNMDFGPEKQETVDSVSDDEMWNTVEAILEGQPTQELIHEPQAQSALPVTETTPEELVEELQEQEVVEEIKPKRKRKSKTNENVTEEIQTNEEE